ncbi:MAG: hypothetical protein ABIK48_03255 [candidate division WOR-3 bacterium]
MNTSKVKITAGLLILMLAGQTAGSRWFYFPTPPGVIPDRVRH